MQTMGGDGETPTPEVAEATSRSAAVSRWLGRRWPQILVLGLAAIPAVHMLTVIGRGSHVQFTDYWVFLSELIDTDGSIRLRALTEFQGQHLLAVPQLVYLANIWVFGGSNIALGWVVVAIVAAQVVVLWRWFDGLQRLPFVVRSSLLILASALLYSPHGAWNFILAMSGTAWLTANLVVLLSIHFAARGRTVVAVLLALVATVTYGTGVLAWPAIVVVILVRRRSVAEMVGVPVVGLVVIAAYVRLRTAQVPTDTIRSPDLWDVLVAMASILGRMAGFNGTVIGVAGGLVLCAVAVLVPLAIWRCGEEALVFVGLAVFGVLGAAQIAYGRVGVIGSASGVMASRYASLSALTWIAVAGLVVLVVASFDLGGWNATVLRAMVVPVALLAIAAPLHGHGEVRRLLSDGKRHLHLSDAQRIKVSRGHRWFAFIDQPDIDDRLERVGHHPFDGRWNADCGLLGQVFDRPLAEVDGSASRRVVDTLADGVQVRGKVEVRRSEVDCVVVLDDRGVAVGVGRAAFGSDDEDGEVRVLAFAPRDADLSTLVIYFPDDDRWVGLEVRGDHGP